MGYLILILIGAITILFAAIALQRSLSAKERTKEARQQGTEPAKQRSQPDGEDRQQEKSAHLMLILARVNLKLRCTQPVDADVVSIVERQIDLLRELLPACMRQYPGAEMTHTLERTAATYLPDTLARYLAMSESDRASKKAQFTGAMGKIIERLLQYRKAIEENAVRQYAVEEGFLDQKFKDSLSI